MASWMKLANGMLGAMTLKIWHADCVRWNWAGVGPVLWCFPMRLCPTFADILDEGMGTLLTLTLTEDRQLLYCDNIQVAQLFLNQCLDMFQAVVHHQL